jgi:hypothetical protein
MIIEMRTYLLKPGTVPAFLEQIGHCFLKSATENSKLLAASPQWPAFRDLGQRAEVPD